MRVGPHGAFCGDGGGGDGAGFGGLIGGVGDAADVHELDGDAAAFGVDGVDDVGPGFDLFGGVDGGGAGVAEAGIGGCDAFGEDEAGGGALGVILFDESIRGVVLDGAGAGHGGHDDAVGQVDGAGGGGGEEGAHR